MLRAFTKLCGIFVLIGFSVVNSFSQTTADEAKIVEQLKQTPLKGHFGIYFNNSIPQKELYNNLQRSGPGFSLNGGYTLEPLTFGMQADFLFYGGDTKYFTYNRPGGWKGAVDTVTYQNMIIPVTFYVQFKPNVANLIYPYVEGFAGFNLMSATADFKPAYGPKDDKSDFSGSWNYGVGVGTKIKLVDFIQLPNSYTRLMLDAKLRYMRGTEANYAMVKQILPDSSPEFKTYRSKTDMVTFQLGVSFEF